MNQPLAGAANDRGHRVHRVPEGAARRLMEVTYALTGHISFFGGKASNMRGRSRWSRHRQRTALSVFRAMCVAKVAIRGDR